MFCAVTHPAVRLDLRDHFIGEFGRVRMIDANPNTLCGKSFRNGATDAGGGPGHQRGSHPSNQYSSQT